MKLDNRQISHDLRKCLVYLSCVSSEFTNSHVFRLNWFDRTSRLNWLTEILFLSLIIMIDISFESEFNSKKNIRWRTWSSLSYRRSKWSALYFLNDRFRIIIARLNDDIVNLTIINKVSSWFMRSTSHILHRICFLKYRSRYHVYQVFLFDWEYEFRKRKKGSCHPVQSISFFPNICWYFTWFLTSSLHLNHSLFILQSNIIVTPNGFFIYILLDSYTTFSDSSMFHHSFSVTDLNHFLISTSISSFLNVRLQFESEKFRYTLEHFRSSKTFLLAKHEFYTDLREFFNLKCP